MLSRNKLFGAIASLQICNCIKIVTKLVIILQPPGVCFIDLLRRHELLVDKSKRVGATYYPSFILIRNPVAPELQDLVSIIFLPHSVSLFGEGYV